MTYVQFALQWGYILILLGAAGTLAVFLSRPRKANTSLAATLAVVYCQIFSALFLATLRHGRSWPWMPDGLVDYLDHTRGYVLECAATTPILLFGFKLLSETHNNEFMSAIAFSSVMNLVTLWAIDTHHFFRKLVLFAASLALLVTVLRKIFYWRAHPGGRFWGADYERLVVITSFGYLSFGIPSFLGPNCFHFVSHNIETVLAVLCNLFLKISWGVAVSQLNCSNTHGHRQHNTSSKHADHSKDKEIKKNLKKSK
eukprot:TRINITY_DN4257_c0_g1_i2.p1 TRINITY_DN4257_c0_g1~~TRINITY_DN4257_c0_g1_i2.p1  ORF type:complete len:265 (-),score=48.83 TRINITY_DN4257_c0_g1_i2:69-836(-)